MAKKILWSGSTVLPSPVSISVNDQIIWSANTGRSASGSMIGDVVAEKKDVAIKWGILTEAELAAIKKIMVIPEFFRSRNQKTMERPMF